MNGCPQARYKSSKLDGEQEAHWMALACSTLPTGRTRWSVRLLADRRAYLRADSSGTNTFEDHWWDKGYVSPDPVPPVPLLYANGPC